MHINLFFSFSSLPSWRTVYHSNRLTRANGIKWYIVFQVYLHENFSDWLQLKIWILNGIGNANYLKWLNFKGDSVKDLKDFNSLSLSAQAKKGEQLVSMMPAIKKTFDLTGDDIVEISTENEPLKIKISSYEWKLLEQSKTRILKQIDGERRANLKMSRKEKRMQKKIKFK